MIDRAALEKKLAAALGDKLNGKLPELMGFLGDPPNPDNVPETFWTDLGADLASEIKPQLQAVYASSRVDLGNDLHNRFQVDPGITVDWKLAYQKAATWAENYTFDLVKGIDATSRDRLQTVISGFFENQMDIGELRDELEPIFGAERAAMIATTEVTNAANWGEWDTIQWIEANSSINMIATWNTDEDEHVCDICGALDGQPEAGRDESDEPYWELDGEQYDIGAAHTRCRCRKSYEPEGWGN